MAHIQPSYASDSCNVAMEDGMGIGSPWTMASSIHSEMASLAFSMACSMPSSAAEKHPGRSGTITPQAVWSVPGSIAIGYFMALSLMGFLGRFSRSETTSSQWNMEQSCHFELTEFLSDNTSNTPTMVE